MLTDMFKFCNTVGTYVQKLCHVANSQEDLGMKRVRIVFKYMFDPKTIDYE
jgi:hypothetical protein